jgi:hypothetical protein
VSAQKTKITLSNLGGSGDAAKFLDDALFFEKHCGTVVNSTKQINEMIKSRLEREGSAAAA